MRSGPPPNLEGRVLGGRYRVFRAIGEGGMGAVYAALQLDLQRRVAIKILHGAEHLSPESVGRFRQEALAAAELGHPNIVQVTDFQVNPGEPPFLVMEMLEGESLQALLERERVLPQERAAFIAAQVLAALAAAHATRIVHRDIKPGNVFLTRTPAMGDLVKVLDFGIAKVVREADDGPLSAAGRIVGTPAYMAPEQARGSDVDARADLYSLGACMFEMLAGRRPFPEEGDAAVSARNAPVSARNAPPLASVAPRVDPRLAAMVDRALSPDRNARPASALEMLRAISPSVRAPSSGDVSAGHTQRSEESGSGSAPSTERMHAPPTHPSSPPQPSPPPQPSSAPRASPSHASRAVELPRPPVSANARGALVGVAAFAALAIVAGAAFCIVWARQRTVAPSPPSSASSLPVRAPPAPTAYRLWYSRAEPLPGAFVGDATEDFAGGFSESTDPTGRTPALYFAVIDGATMQPAWRTKPLDLLTPAQLGVVGQRVLVATGVHEVTVYDAATGDVLHVIDTVLPVVQLCTPIGSTKEVWIELEKSRELTLDVEAASSRDTTGAPPGCRYRNPFGKARAPRPTSDAHATVENRRVGDRWVQLLVEGGLAVHSSRADNHDEVVEGFTMPSLKPIWSRRDPPTMRYPHVIDLLGGRAFLQDNTQLECVDASNGTSLWKAATKMTTLTRLNASATRVYLVGAGGVLVLDAKTGQTVGTFGPVI